EKQVLEDRRVAQAEPAAASVVDGGNEPAGGTAGELAAVESQSSNIVAADETTANTAAGATAALDASGARAAVEPVAASATTATPSSVAVEAVGDETGAVVLD